MQQQISQLLATSLSSTFDAHHNTQLLSLLSHPHSFQALVQIIESSHDEQIIYAAIIQLKNKILTLHKNEEILNFLTYQLFSIIYEKINERNHKVFRNCVNYGVRMYGVEWLPLQFIEGYIMKNKVGTDSKFPFLMNCFTGIVDAFLQQEKEKELIKRMLKAVINQIGGVINWKELHFELKFICKCLERAREDKNEGLHQQFVVYAPILISLGLKIHSTKDEEVNSQEHNQKSCHKWLMKAINKMFREDIWGNNQQVFIFREIWEQDFSVNFIQMTLIGLLFGPNSNPFETKKLSLERLQFVRKIAKFSHPSLQRFQLLLLYQILPSLIKRRQSYIQIYEEAYGGNDDEEAMLCGEIIDECLSLWAELADLDIYVHDIENRKSLKSVEGVKCHEDSLGAFNHHFRFITDHLDSDDSQSVILALNLMKAVKAGLKKRRKEQIYKNIRLFFLIMVLPKLLHPDIQIKMHCLDVIQAYSEFFRQISLVGPISEFVMKAMQQEQLPVIKMLLLVLPALHHNKTIELLVDESGMEIIKKYYHILQDRRNGCTQIYLSIFSHFIDIFGYKVMEKSRCNFAAEIFNQLVNQVLKGNENEGNEEDYNLPFMLMESLIRCNEKCGFGNWEESFQDSIRNLTKAILSNGDGEIEMRMYFIYESLGQTIGTYLEESIAIDKDKEIYQQIFLASCFTLSGLQIEPFSQVSEDLMLKSLNLVDSSNRRPEFEIVKNCFVFLHLLTAKECFFKFNAKMGDKPINVCLKTLSSCLLAFANNQEQGLDITEKEYIKSACTEILIFIIQNLSERDNEEGSEEMYIDMWSIFYFHLLPSHRHSNRHHETNLDHSREGFFEKKGKMERRGVLLLFSLLLKQSMNVAFYFQDAFERPLEDIVKEVLHLPSELGEKEAEQMIYGLMNLLQMEEQHISDETMLTIIEVVSTLIKGRNESSELRSDRMENKKNYFEESLLDCEDESIFDSEEDWRDCNPEKKKEEGKKEISVKCEPFLPFSQHGFRMRDFTLFIWPTQDVDQHSEIFETFRENRRKSMKKFKVPLSRLETLFSTMQLFSMEYFG